jgi:hypothetical protein
MKMYFISYLIFFNAKEESDSKRICTIGFSKIVTFPLQRLFISL